MEISIDYKPEDIRRIERSLSSKQTAKAMRSAINRTLVGGKTDIKKTVTKEYSVKGKDVAETLSVRKVSGSNMNGYIKVGWDGLKLSSFPYKPKKNSSWKGVPNRQRQPKVQVKIKKGRYETWDDIFVATMPSGHKGLFYNRYPDKTRTGKTRITESSGPSITSLVKKHLPKITSLMSERYSKNLLSQLNRFLNKGK